MRVRVQLLHVVALAGVTLFPVCSEASLITDAAIVPDIATNGVSSSDYPAADSIDHAWANSGLPSLFDDDGDPLLLLSSVNSYPQFGSHGKLRGQGSGPFTSNNFFVPFSGGFGGGSGGGSGFPGSQTFNIHLPSFGTGGNPNPDINLNFDRPLDQCWETSCISGGAAETVPEPSSLILVGSALAMAVRRARRQRAAETR